MSTLKQENSANDGSTGTMSEISGNANSSNITSPNVGQIADSEYWKDPKHWPKSLHNFISRSFKQASKIKMNSTESKQFKTQMKNLINLAVRKGKIMENDWDKQELPLLSGGGINKMMLYCESLEIMKNSAIVLNGKAGSGSGKKRRNIFGEFETDSEEDNEAANASTVTNADGNDNANSTAQKKSFSMNESLKRLKKQKKPVEVKPTPIIRAQKKVSDPLLDDSKLALRSKRFERELSTPVNYSSRDDQISTKPVVGQSTTLEKKYLRLTSQPKPENVRSLKTLKKTLQLLFDKYFEGATYNYLCDQCKSLRQDLTVQNIKNNFTVSAYEFHSKLAIEYQDWGEFNQCQSQLKLLHDIPELGNPHYYEFLSYRVLYYVLTNNFTEAFELELSLMKRGIDYTEDEYLTYAFAIFRYTYNSNYESLARIVNELFAKNMAEEAALKCQTKTQDMQLKIESPDALNLKHNKLYFFTLFVSTILARENIKTLSLISKAYRQIPVVYLKKVMGFSNAENIEHIPGAFFNYLAENKLESFLDESKSTFNCLQARTILDALKNKLFKRIDIKGQI